MYSGTSLRQNFLAIVEKWPLYEGVNGISPRDVDNSRKPGKIPVCRLDFPG